MIKIWNFLMLTSVILLARLDYILLSKGELRSPCHYNAFVGQIITIFKAKVKDCPCQNDKPKYFLPDWLVNSSHHLQGIPVNQDIGTYHVYATQSSCIIVNVVRLNNTGHLQFKCNLRWPTLAAIILDVELSQLSSKQRIDLWNALKQNLKGAAGLRLLEDVGSFERSIFVLANGLGNSDGGMKTKGVSVVWQIGCGSVEFRHLKTLQWLEKSCLIGEFSQLIGGISVEMWLVADLYDRERISRMKREALWQRGKAGLGLQLNERLMDSKFAGSVLEGSGMPGSGDKQNSNKSNSIRSISRLPKPYTVSSIPGPTTPFVPVVRRNLSQVILTIQQINNFKIPRETFYDNQQGYSPSLNVKAFYIFPKTNKKFELLHNDSYWISYDKDLQNIRFLPRPAHIGSHKISLCAIDKEGNQVCESLMIEVRPPTPITKSTVLQIAAGVLWTHEMPSQWLDGLTFNTTADLTFAIEGDAIFCYDQSKAILQVLTEAVESRILKIIFNITNPKEYQTLKYEFTLAVSDISPISYVMSDLFQVKLRWVGDNLYPLNSIKSFLNDFAIALKVGKIANYVDPEDLLIYRILHSRDFRITYRDTNPDDIFALQIVYRPSKNATCLRSALKNAVKYIQTKEQLAYFFIDSIARRPLKGICNHSEKPTTVQKTTSTTPTIPPKPIPKNQTTPIVFDPSKLIENLANVEAGFAFVRELNIKGAINEKLVRYLNFVDEDEKNVTNNNWIGLSPDGTFIYGLPLKQHVRKQVYKFWVILYTVTAHVLKAPFNIYVKSNSWLSRPINHIIKLKLKLLDKSEENQKLNSLNFRIQLVKEIDKVLRPNCGYRCYKDILLFDLKMIQKSLLLIEWSHLPVLDTDGDPKESGLQCPWNNLRSLYKNINGISNYPIGPEFVQLIPPQALSDALQTANIGTVVGVTFERLGSCAVSVPNDIGYDARKINLISNITAFCGQGFRVPIKYLENNESFAPREYVQLFFQTNVAVPRTHWLSVSGSQQFIYGLPMPIHITSGQEYILHFLPQNGRRIQSHFIVTVLSNPFQGSNLNHEIIMQFGLFSYDSFKESVLSSPSIRWKISSALESYLRPDCAVSTTAISIPECAWRLDVIILDITNSSASMVLFYVKWALRSLLKLPTIKQKREVLHIRNKRQPECPENRLLELKRKLVSERDNRFEPLKKLQDHLLTYAGIKLKSVILKSLGPCASTNEPSLVHETSRSSKSQGQEDSQKMFLITTVIPVCAFTICILFVALMIALCMKRRNYSGYMKASQNSQLGPGSPVILPDEIDRSSYPPSKPLILPHEKPPLPPPDYNHESTPNFVTMTTCSYRGPLHLDVNKLHQLEVRHIRMTDFPTVFLDSNQMNISCPITTKIISVRGVI